MKIDTKPYLDFEEKFAERRQSIPTLFAFNEASLAERLTELGVSFKNPKDAIVSIGGGTHFLKSDYAAYKKVVAEGNAEFFELMKKKRFATGAFYTVLNAYEYSWTEDNTEAIEALGYTVEAVYEDVALKACLEAAEKQIKKEKAL